MSKGNGPFCGGKLRHREGTCKRPAGAGTDHGGRGRCSWHGGCSPTHETHARREQALQAAATYGLPIDTTAEQALLDEVARSAGHVAWLAAQVAKLDPEALTWGERTRTVKQTRDAEKVTGAEVTSVFGAGVNIWLDLYQKERAHLRMVCRDAVVTEAAKRAVDVAEMFGEQIAAVYSRALERAGLPAAERDMVAGALAAELRLVGKDEPDEGEAG